VSELVVIIGPIASGKSRVADALGDRFREAGRAVAVFDLDDVVDTIGAIDHQPRDDTAAPRSTRSGVKHCTHRYRVTWSTSIPRSGEELFDIDTKGRTAGTTEPRRRSPQKGTGTRQTLKPGPQWDQREIDAADHCHSPT
jgi:hypothetical protein